MLPPSREPTSHFQKRPVDMLAGVRGNFKKNISEKVITNAFQTLESAPAPIRWVMVDDGYLHEKKGRLLNCIAQPNVNSLQAKYNALTRSSPGYKQKNKKKNKCNTYQSFANHLWMGQTVWGAWPCFMLTIRMTFTRWQSLVRSREARSTSRTNRRKSCRRCFILLPTPMASCYGLKPPRHCCLRVFLFTRSATKRFLCRRTAGGRCGSDCDIQFF